MRRCRTEWLLAPCIISVLLISPTVCEGLLVGASNISPPALTPLVIKQVDDLVEHAWLKCGLDKKSLQDVKNYFNYDHVLDILHRISDNKDTSPVLEQGTSPLTPEIKQTLLICLSKQSFEVEKNLPDGYIRTLIAAIRRELMLGLAANQAVKSVPGKPTESASSETTPTKKTAVPPTKSVAEKDKYGMLTTTIGLSLIAVALLGVFFCIYHEIQSSAYDNKTLLDLTNSFSSSELNQMDVNKLGVFSLNSEAGQNGYVYQSSYEATDTDQNGYVKLSSQEVPHTGQNSHVTLNSPEDPNTGPNSHVKLGSREDQNTGPNGYVKLGSQEDQNTCQNSHVELVSLGSANIDPAVYDSSSEKMADSVGSVEGSTPVPQQAAILDADQLTMSVASLDQKLVKTSEFLNTSMKSLDEDSGFHHKLVRFVEKSQADVTSLLEEEKKIWTLVKGTVRFFHGSTGKDEGLRLFVIVRDFLEMLDKECKEVKETSKVAAPTKTARS
uniref:Uncharacterized protein n=1 Tax=Avena sativa TaxID=4498 RepID=A0ACD5U7R7_AVESA